MTLPLPSYLTHPSKESFSQPATLRYRCMVPLIITPASSSPALFAQDLTLLDIVVVHDVLTEERAIGVRDGDLDQEHCFLLFMLRFVLLAAGQVHPDQ